MVMIRKGDRVTVEGRIYGAKVVSVNGGSVKVKYWDVHSGAVVRNVSIVDVEKEG